MATTPKGYPYPAATDAPDGAGGIYNLAIALDNATSSWGPVLGGGAGEAIGSTGSTIGHAFQLAGAVTLTGRLAFGSGTISLGTNPTITGSPHNLEQATASGRATLTRGGLYVTSWELVASSPSQFAIAGAGGYAIQQSDTITFRIFGVKA